MHAANTVNAKCDAFRAKILSQKRAQGGHRLLQNSLFHNGFCNSVGVRTNLSRVARVCIQLVRLSENCVAACRKPLACTFDQAVTFFFSLRCSKPSASACRFATRADATPAMFQARRAAMAKRRKKAAAKSSEEDEAPQEEA